MSNGQNYLIAKKSIIEFINGVDFDYKNRSEIARASGLTARTVARVMAFGQVNSGTAREIYKLCVKQGFKGSFEESFEAK